MWAGKQPVANAPTPSTQPAAAAGTPQKVFVPAPSQHKPQTHAEPLNPTCVQLQRSSRQSQDKPGQKRTQTLSGLSHQRAKQQRLVYNEFSTSTDSTSESDCSAPSVGTEDGMGPHEQPSHPAKTPKPQQQQQQQPTPGSASCKLTAAGPAARHNAPGPVLCPDKDKQGGGDWQPAVSDRGSEPPQLKAYSHSRKAAQTPKPSAGATTKAAMNKDKQAAQVIAAHAAERTKLAKYSIPQQSAVQVHLDRQRCISVF